METRPNRRAFGAPGIEPRWTRSDKMAIGTAYSVASRIWFTLAAGIVSEVYYPTIDRPQIRDLQYLISDGTTFFHDERRHLNSVVEQLHPSTLGYRMTNTAIDRPYRIVKEVISDPHHPTLLVHTRVEGDEDLLSKLRLYVLLAPHLEMGGAGNTAYLDDVAGYQVLMAHKGATWLALGASIPFLRRSCGYVGQSDGWSDLDHNYEMDWEFDLADNGNVALMAQLDLAQRASSPSRWPLATASTMPRPRWCNRWASDLPSIASVSSSNGIASVVTSRRSTGNRATTACSIAAATICCWLMKTNCFPAR